VIATLRLVDPHGVSIVVTLLAKRRPAGLAQLKTAKTGQFDCQNARGSAWPRKSDSRHPWPSPLGNAGDARIAANHLRPSVRHPAPARRACGRSEAATSLRSK
jgi:hypothetical protein